MSKIDDLCATVARIEQKVDDIKPRIDSHSVQIQRHEVNLNGSGECEGLNEWKRTLSRRHAFSITLVPSGIFIIWEVLKHKLTGKW